MHRARVRTSLHRYLKAGFRPRPITRMNSHPMSSAAMSVTASLKKRFSVRAFKHTPVPQEVLEEIFTLARHAPSNCNVQPCQAYVVSGARNDQLQRELVNAVLSGSRPNPDFEWDVRYQGVHRERQFGSANALYGAMGIDRSDKERRQAAMLRNWQFFGAPHAAFFTMEKIPQDYRRRRSRHLRADAWRC